MLWAEERDTRLKDLKVHLPGEDACANLVQSATHMRLVNCVLLFMTCLRLVCSHCACGLVCHRKARHSSEPTVLEAHHVGLLDKRCTFAVLTWNVSMMAGCGYTKSDVLDLLAKPGLSEAKQEYWDSECAVCHSPATNSCRSLATKTYPCLFADHLRRRVL